MRRPWLVALALSLVVVTLGAVVLTRGRTAERPQQGSLAQADPCARGLVIAVPGSGEGDPAAEPGSSQALGRTLGPLVTGLGTGAAAAGRSLQVTSVVATTPGVATLRGRGTGRTPAVDAVTRGAWRTWHAPVPGLTARVRSTLLAATQECPARLVYLVGFAQGAEAVHRALASVDAGTQLWVAGALLVADPARATDTPGRMRGAPSAPRTALGVTARFSRHPLPALSVAGSTAPVRYLCQRRDAVCDLTRVRFADAKAAHRGYRAEEPVRQQSATGVRYGARLASWPVPDAASLKARVARVVDRQLSATVAETAAPHLRWGDAQGLPAGLRLTRTGEVRGIPEQDGTFEVSYTVRNTADPSLSLPIVGSATLEVLPDLSTQVSAGGRHACGVRSDGTLWCWGANFYGQLGTGDRVGHNEPVQVGRGTSWTQVSAGGMHTCATKSTGTLWCWGLNYRGQLGLGGRGDKLRPQQVGDATDWASVSAGWVHTCGVRTDGSAWCWGNDAYGQLGDGGTTNRYTPVPVASGAWASVEAGGWHTCGVRTDGTAWCWGRNLAGELGTGQPGNRSQPTQVGAQADWSRVLPAWSSTCGLRTGGSIWCWGGNEGGQLGTGDRQNRGVPTQVAADHGWTALGVQTSATCATDEQQLLWCWGTGRYGQLGSADPVVSLAPVRVGDDTAYVGLDAGWLFACAARAVGEPSCWGSNEVGELGVGDTTMRTTPSPLTFDEDAAARSRTTSGAHEPAEHATVRPATPSRRSAATPARRRETSFVLTTFNVLGSNHSAPRSDAGEFSPARVRAEWSLDYLRAIDSSVVGFQELQTDQLSWLAQGGRDRWSLWPGTSAGPGAVQTTVAWRSDQWTLLDTDLVPIPFLDQTRQMPLVHLENVATGARVWVMNIHNAPQGRQQERNVAVRREIDRLQRIKGDDPVFLIGDFNERRTAFCKVTGALPMVDPRGGSNDGSTCRTPPGLQRVDWIFGSRTVSFSGYVQDRRPLVQRITDHAVISTRVTLP